MLLDCYPFLQRVGVLEDELQEKKGIMVEEIWSVHQEKPKTSKRIKTGRFGWSPVNYKATFTYTKQKIHICML